MEEKERIDGNVSKVKDYSLSNVNIPLFKNACIIVVVGCKGWTGEKGFKVILSPLSQVNFDRFSRRFAKQSFLEDFKLSKTFCSHIAKKRRNKKVNLHF